MSRPPRQLSSTGLYHIIFRGMNRQNIFEETKDFEKLLTIINLTKDEYKFELYAYCLMSNHVHLFIKENVIGDIKKIMHKMLSSYVSWFNYKYERSGSLIGNRYKSEPVEDDAYYLELVKYIHENPVKAKLVNTADEYEWCSYSDYINDKPTIVDTEFMLSMLAENKETALTSFIDFHESDSSCYFSISDRFRLTDSQAKNKIKSIIGKYSINDLVNLPKQDRDNFIRLIRADGNISIRQLERLTGISRGIISRII